MQPDYILETSWEVCNMIGGIYTVLSTKAKTLQKLYKDKTIFVGPDVWKETPSPYFTESKTLLKEWKAKATAEGLVVKVGRWNIPGKPIVILVDFESYYEKQNLLFSDMWNWYGVDSLPANGDYFEACAFSHAVAEVMESFYRFVEGDKLNIVAHFNEWTTGMGLLHVKHTIPAIATIFTTHATSMGRSIAGNNKPLYDYLEGYNGDQMAQELNMVAKQSLEKQAAQQCDCFTTVSDITARECTQLLERKPDIVTPNGFESNFVPKAAAFKEKREEAREALLKVAKNLVGYTPDQDAFLIATSGRFEFKNKGIDLFIESLCKLKVEKGEQGREIIAFILVPAYVNETRADLVDRMSCGCSPKQPLPDPICTHTLHNYEHDVIVNRLHESHIVNEANQKVKIIYVPSYLTGNDGLFNVSYYDLLIGFDATAFPSYYEPWGYTPLESVAFGVPTITTNLSGFGMWVKGLEISDEQKAGAVVLYRNDANFDELSVAMANTINEMATLDTKAKTAIDKAATKLAKEAAWAKFIEHYEVAFDMALKKVK